MKRNTYEIAFNGLVHTVSVPTEEGNGWESLVEALWVSYVRDKEAVEKVEYIYCSSYEIVGWQKPYLKAIRGRK